MAVLEVEKLVVNYGGITALNSVSLSVEAREVVAIIGPNGSGKTTLLRAISGLSPVLSGRIRLKGCDIARLPAHRRVRLGLVCAPERARVAAEMSVLENLMIGAYLRRDKEGIQATMREIFELFPCFEKNRDKMAGALSGGEKQMLVIGRALMVKPEVLLLDEPFFGLSMGMKQVLVKAIRRIQKNGVTVMLTEHDLNSVMKVAERIYGFCTGRIIFSGTAEQFKRDNPVHKIYA